ncbi:YbaB/EbfC family nucleoid-associated protein [Mycoplasma sp. Mirounga ES2805-ORL]|uniref:YbaB/EbfC family nucleoid-associated protein n=1 Tax=Mycoplasma sp. Mirounga ES2805-ORL TaxID=754514 RepID=UPI00197B8D86|nr:YbaB/EbfC family nucleoid-associated protein [Mycoplasma sp. Mirounga ES2805-ORL]QSF13393.1 YbaB/EbfC family nucleoid-associated protein [Mycoplasma sp. Mirounga ES2805-ORL]
MDQALLRKMQKMQQELQTKTEEFYETIFEIEKHGIEIKAKGSKKIVSIKIKDSILLDPEDSETIEDLLVLTINELFSTIDEKQEDLMPAMPTGLPF